MKEIKDVIGEILKNKKKQGGIKQIYFVACGGSLGSLYPAKVFVETEASEIKCGWYNSNEFVHNTPRSFGENSLLIVTSHKGNTPETVQAAKKGKEMGAAVIAMTWIEDSPLCEFADYIITYTFGNDKDISGEKTIQGLKIAVELVNQVEGYTYYDDFYDGVAKIDTVVKKACKLVKKRAESFAREYKNDNVIYTMASGAGFGAAYMESICIFMEMQWINSSSIHSGEFFHGPFEITDKEIPFVIQISEGATRELDERALKFLKQYGSRIEILDAKELGLSVIKNTVITYFNHSLFNNVYVVYNEALANARNHPLTTRRYMWKVSY